MSMLTLMFVISLPSSKILTQQHQQCLPQPSFGLKTSFWVPLFDKFWPAHSHFLAQNLTDFSPFLVEIKVFFLERSLLSTQMKKSVVKESFSLPSLSLVLQEKKCCFVDEKVDGAGCWVLKYDGRRVLLYWQKLRGVLRSGRIHTFLVGLRKTHSCSDSRRRPFQNSFWVL